MPHDVFISYSSIDKSYADTVCSILEQNGTPCWMAPRDITPGVPFAEAIIKAIKESKVFILVYTQNSNGSQQVIKEVDRAVHHGLTVITLRLEDVKMSDQLEYYISDVHWLDAMSPPLEQHINRLSKVVNMLMSKDEVRDDDLEKAIRKGTLRLGKTGKPGSAAERHRLTWKSAVAAAALIMAILVTVFLVMPRLSRQIDKSVAVLPFDNLSADPDQEYFSDGMMDEILDRLFKIGDLRVISRTSSMRYKNSELSIKEIAGQLGVSAILEGSVRRAGNLVRITVQLIDARNDTHLWSEVYDGDLSDLSKIFAMQTDVAQSVARELKAVLAPEEKQLIEKIPTLDLEVYDIYLKGKFYLEKGIQGDIDDIDNALHYFEQAKERDPGFALAYAGIGNVWMTRQQLMIVPPGEAVPKIMEAVGKALELDSTLVDVHQTVAVMNAYVLWDWEAAESAYKKVIEINPKHPEAHALYSQLLITLGRTEEAMEHAELALKLDPNNIMVLMAYYTNLFAAYRYDDVISLSRETFEKDPTNFLILGPLIGALHEVGRYEEAVKEMGLYFSYYLKDFDHVFDQYEQLGYIGTLTLEADTLEAQSKSKYLSPTIMYSLYGWAGNKEKSLDWMEKAFEMHDPNLAYNISYPYWTSLCNEPRYLELLRKMNLPLPKSE